MNTNSSMPLSSNWTIIVCVALCRSARRHTHYTYRISNVINWDFPFIKSKVKCCVCICYLCTHRHTHASGTCGHFWPNQDFLKTNFINANNLEWMERICSLRIYRLNIVNGCRIWTRRRCRRCHHCRSPFWWASLQHSQSPYLWWWHRLPTFYMRKCLDK